MKTVSLGVLGLLAVICLPSCIADVRPALQAADDHFAAISDTGRILPGAPAAERLVLAEFHASRGRAWTSILRRREGEPETPVVIPRTPEDGREILEENIRVRELDQAVRLEDRLKALASGWLGKLGIGVAGAGGIGAIALAFVRRKLRSLAADRDRERDAADDLHDAVEEMKDAAKNGGLKEKRFGEIMNQRPAARRKHAQKKLDAVS